MNSPIYFHPWIYEAVMRFLYGGQYLERLQAVAALIPEGSRVADVCAGDCSLYRYALKDKNIDYVAFDINPRFAFWAGSHGISMTVIDLRVDNIPQADCVVMLGALYQFIPHERLMIEKLLQAARRIVILAEPIHNVAQSRIPLLRWMGRLATRVGDNPCSRRFDETSLRAFLGEYGFQSIRSLAGGRELLAVYTATNSG